MYVFDENDIFIRGNYVDLKTLTEEDIEYTSWYSWFNDEETTKFMQKHYFPNTKEMQKSFLENLKRDHSKLQLGVVEKKERKFIGIVSIQNINFINQNAEVSYLLGDKEFRKVTHTEEVMRLMIEHGFFTLNLRKLYGGTISKEWALFLQRIFSFEREGILKEHVYKNGVFQDVYQLALYREQYLARKKDSR